MYYYTPPYCDCGTHFNIKIKEYENCHLKWTFWYKEQAHPTVENLGILIYYVHISFHSNSHPEGSPVPPFLSLSFAPTPFHISLSHSLLSKYKCILLFVCLFVRYLMCVIFFPSFSLKFNVYCTFRQIVIADILTLGEERK